MTQPLALLLYEKLLPGSQLVNRLQDLGWRVQTLHDSAALVRTAEDCKPLLVLADLAPSSPDTCASIARLRSHAGTNHLPIIAFGADVAQHQAAVTAGASLAVSDTTILQHLKQFIDQALNDF